MQYELRVAVHGVTDVGKVRSKNEDSLLILDRQRVYCVADGMGGVSGGEIASQKVIQCINEQIGRLNASVSLNDKMLSIHQAVIQANEWILGWSGKNEVQGAGTTLVLLVLSSEYPWAVNILHAGDSRAYRYRGGQLQQITVDHSIEEAVGDNSGQPLPSQFKGLITNAVGLKRSLALELTHAEQMAGDIWLLCSDGLDKMLSDEAIASVLASDGDANALAQRLVDEANAAGGKDNVSVVIVKVLECSNRPTGALSVPFPGPLPGVLEEDEASTETSMTEMLSMDTETNGSVMMSLETPNSETDFLSQEGGAGIKMIVRWILLALAGVVIAFVLWKLFSGHEIPSTAEVQVSAPSSVVDPGVGVEPAMSIEEIVAMAEQSGDWKKAYSMTQQGDYVKIGEHMRSKKTIEIWYGLVWEEANRDPHDAMMALPEFIAAANKVLAAINRDALPSAAPWPKESARIANEFCRRRYNLQQQLVKELDEFWAFNSRRINFIEMLPDEHVAAAFKVSGSEGRKYKEFDRLLRDAKYAVQELERWLKGRSSLPIIKAQLESLPDSHIKYCNKVDIVVDQLVAVLREKPELKDNGNVDPESKLQKDLKQIQSEWRSIQDSLRNLDSGELSAREERSIRQYLEGLFQFEEMVEQGMNHLNR